jgi:hypothetical protein
MSEPFKSKAIRSVFDLGDLYASLNEEQRARLLNDIKGALDLWTKQPALVRLLFRLCGRPKWIDDDKGLVHVNVRMTEGSEPLHSTVVKMKDFA